MKENVYVELVAAAVDGDIDKVMELGSKITASSPEALVAVEMVAMAESPNLAMIDALVDIGIPMSGTLHLALGALPGAAASMALKHYSIISIIKDPVAGVGKLERALEGYDPNYINGKALSIAVSSGDMAAVKLLVGMGVDPTISAHALWVAVVRPDLRMTMYLVEHGWSIQGCAGGIAAEAVVDGNEAIATYFQYKLGDVELMSLVPENKYY